MQEKRMGREDTMLSKVSQRQKDMAFMFCLYVDSRINNNVDLEIVGELLGKCEDKRDGGGGNGQARRRG